jgi:hypothetical protein
MTGKDIESYSIIIKRDKTAGGGIAIIKIIL